MKPVGRIMSLIMKVYSLNAESALLLPMRAIDEARSIRVTAPMKIPADR